MIDLKNITKENRESLKLYKELLSHYTNDQLSTPMPAGWTVSAVLVHLAFWDHRAFVLLEKWEKDGIVFSPNDIDVVNDATKLLCLAVPPLKAVDMFLKSAEIIDQKISTLDAQWAADVVEKGKNVNLSRAHHRMMHLEDIKVVLGKA